MGSSNAGLADPGLGTAELDAAWVAARAETARHFLLIVTVLATAGHLIWVPVDFALEPGVAWQLLALRGVDEVLTLALYLIGRRETRLPRLMTCIALLFLGIGTAVALMFAFVREYLFAYVLGLMMILFASGLFVAWSTAYQLATNLFVFAAYLLVSWTRSSAATPTLIGSSACLGCVILVVAAMSTGRRKTR